MDKQINEIIKKIIHIPSDFYHRGNVSELSLLLESGYLEFYKKIHEDEIAEVLVAQPYLIIEWLQWSDDKRSTPTWHFYKNEDGKYFVEFSSADNEFEGVSYTDKFQACAAFIKREVESNRLLLVTSGYPDNAE